MHRIAVATLIAALATAGCSVPEVPAQDEAPDHALAITDAPDGWCHSEYEMSADEEGTRSLVLTDLDGNANVIVSSEPLDASIDTREYARSQGALLRDEFEAYEELADGGSDAFGGGVVREFEWSPESDLDVWQVQAYRAQDGLGFVATGTTRASAGDELKDTLRAAVEHARSFDPDDAPVPTMCPGATAAP